MKHEALTSNPEKIRIIDMARVQHVQTGARLENVENSTPSVPATTIRRSVSLLYLLMIFSSQRI